MRIPGIENSRYAVGVKTLARMVWGNFLDAIASPSSYPCGSVSGWVGQWVIVSDFPSLSAVVAGVWTQVDPCGPCGPRWTSFPFHRSDYLCVAMFEVPKIQFFLLVPDEGTLVQLGPHGTWVHMGPPVPTWVYLGRLWSSWVHMGPHQRRYLPFFGSDIRVKSE